MRVLLAALLISVLSACQDYGSSIPAKELTAPASMDWHAGQVLSDPRFHSVSIGVYDSGKTYSVHAGELTVGESNAPADNTLYELGSVSKVFAGTLTAQAVLGKKIKLDDDVRPYLRSYLEALNEGSPVPSFNNLSFNGAPIRIRHLLAHTSGLPNIIGGLDNKDQFFTELSKLEINQLPGDSFAYSNTAPELLAIILESVYQQPYEEALRQLVFDPLEMSDTVISLSPEARSRLAHGYNEDAKLMPNLNVSLWGGAVGVHSTSSDLLKFLTYQLAASSPEVIESRRILHKVRPGLSVAYFWQTVEGRSTTAYRHHGGIYGMQNWMMVYPDYDIGISVISNASFDGVSERLEYMSNSLLADLLRMREAEE